MFSPSVKISKNLLRSSIAFNRKYLLAAFQSQKYGIFEQFIYLFCIIFRIFPLLSTHHTLSYLKLFILISALSFIRLNLILISEKHKNLMLLLWAEVLLELHQQEKF